MGLYCILFNNMINNSYFPKFGKKAKVVMIPKKSNDTSNLNNLRAISLLPNISKVFEMCINSYIDNWCQMKKLIDNNQFGFKFRHSTTHAINLLISSINWNLNKGLCTGACLIDFEKAFDSVWIPGLIYKLHKMPFPIKFIVLLYNMINDKCFKVFHNDCISEDFFIVNGLQQGTINALILFNIFISELLSQESNMIAYADDLLIFHADSRIEFKNAKLQKKFDLVEQ